MLRALSRIHLDIRIWLNLKNKGNLSSSIRFERLNADCCSLHLSPMAPLLHIEVIRKQNSNISSKELYVNIKQYLKTRETLVLGNKVELPQDLESEVEEVRICELELLYDKYSDDEDVCVNGTRKLHQKIHPADVGFRLHVYRLCHEGSQAEMIDDHSDEIDVNAAYYWTLPCAQFHGLWDSLVFDSDIKDRLLHYGCAMLSYSEHGVDSTIISSNRVILLHGPPGTGKTTLCKAISQKLSVRMSTSYDHTVLIEINTHSLFSKYFSESGKLVTKMFNKIGEVIADPKTLVCVLIDEVESLAHSRAAASSGSEPSDSIRVVNSVLTQLDLLKTKPNVLILTTSNITGAIDIAFVDRADIKQLIPCPSAFAIYTIHYSCLQELIRVGMITGALPPRIEDHDTFNNVECTPESPQDLLIRLSNASCGLSGRALRKIPLLVHSFYINPKEIVSICKFIKAMFRVIQTNKEQLDSAINEKKST